MGRSLSNKGLAASSGTLAGIGCYQPRFLLENIVDYKKVIEDFNNGTIDPAKFQVVMDNDGGYWSYVGDGNDYENQDHLVEALEKKYGSPGGYNDIVAVLNAAGVNSDWC